MHAATAHHEQLLKKSKGRSIKKPREVVTMVFQYLGELESDNIPNNLLPPFILENTCSPLLLEVHCLNSRIYVTLRTSMPV